MGNFTKPRRERYWLIFEGGSVSVCLQDPGFDPDLLVSADTVALHRVYLGRMTLREAIHDDLIRLEGPRRLVRAFPRWFTWSRFAPTIQDAMAGRSPSE